MNNSNSPDRRIIKEAAQWLTRLHSGEASAADHQACEQWRGQSDAHLKAWHLTEQLMTRFEAVPADLNLAAALSRPSRGRRDTLRALSFFLVAGSASWLAFRLPWCEWSADYKTAAGQRRDITLADGTALTLNTASAVNVKFDQTQRRLTLLAGEIRVATAVDRANTPRSFIIQSAEGSVRTLSATVNLRRDKGLTHVAVIEGMVEVCPADASQTQWVHAGEHCSFAPGAMNRVTAIKGREDLWVQGLLHADNMRLADFLHELARYRSGQLLCAPSLASLRISGVYQLDDIDHILTFLQRRYPLKVREITPYLLIVEPLDQWV